VVDSASNRNEYQEHFLGSKGGRCVRLTTLPASCAVVMKSGSLNFLETSGPLQACNETDLPLYLLTAIGLTLCGSSTAHIYTQTIHRTAQLFWEECGPCPVFASYTLVFALQLRKKHGKTSVRVAEECHLARYYCLRESSFWGLFNRASSSWNNVKCQLDATR